MRKIKVDWLEHALDGLGTIVGMRGRADKLPAHLLVGINGEDAAFFYLRQKGYTIVARRWTSGDVRGDVDLIAWQGPILGFIEVKTRTAHDMAPAEVAVDWHNRTVLRGLARRYVRQLPQKAAPPVRFVYLVAGMEKEFKHFEGSFGWSEEYRY